MQTTSKPTQLLTETDLAELTKRTKRTIQKDRLLGKGPQYLKLGRSVRYKLADVLEYLERCPRGGAQ
jgi:hypothetical protein